MLKILLRLSKVIEGPFDVTSGLIQNAPIKLKFDMNYRCVNLIVWMLMYQNLNLWEFREQFDFFLGGGS